MFFSKLLSAIVLGIFCASFFIQHDSWYQEKIKKRVITFFENSYHCHFETEIAHVNFITGLLTLKNSQACSLIPDDWKWKADTIYVHFSYLPALFFKKPVEIIITIKNLQLHSTFKNKLPAIVEHISLLMKPSTARIPSHVKKFEILNATTTVEHVPADLRINFNLLNFELYNLKGLSKILTLIKNGSCKWQDKGLFTDIQGNLHVQLPLKKDSIFAPFTVALRGKTGKSCQESTLSLKTTEKEILISYAVINTPYLLTASWDAHETFTANFVLSLAHILDIVHKPLPLKGILSGTLFYNHYGFKGEVTSKDTCYEELPLPDFNITAQQKSDLLEGQLALTLAQNSLMSGNWQWNLLNKTALCTAHNPEELVYKTIKIPAHTLSFAASFPAARANLSYTILDAYNKKYKGESTLIYKHTMLELNTRIEDFFIKSIFNIFPSFYCEQAHITHNKEQKFLLKTESNGHFKGLLEYSLIGELLRKVGSTITGQGRINFKGYPFNNNLKVRWELENGSIYLPAFANSIQKAQGECVLSPSQKLLNIVNTLISFYKGSLAVKQAQLYLAADRSIAFTFPLTFTDCFMRSHKDIFAFMSGVLCIKKHPKIQKIEGFITIDQGFMRSNMFSFPLHNTVPSSSQFNPLLDVRVETQNPCLVQTPFLDTQITANLTVKGTRSQPTFSGKIHLQKGTFNFPYKPLFITQGTLYFLPTSLNPLLDINARNIIKKYAIDLSLGGTLKNPTITFSSYPTLAPEQIITLLLGGSEDGSLFLSMPQVLTNYVEDLLFGPAGNSYKILQKIKQLFKPLKNVRFVPNFTDKTGRGGVRGSLAIEVNDRLQGLIQQNFSLSEDTRLEVEYALSDDTTLRALKDERGDVGAELEMRWKW